MQGTVRTFPEQARGSAIPEDHAQAILRDAQPPPANSTWEISREDFEELPAAKRESAPSLDGLPEALEGSALPSSSGPTGTSYEAGGRLPAAEPSLSRNLIWWIAMAS